MVSDHMAMPVLPFVRVPLHYSAEDRLVSAGTLEAQAP
jgi:hypothetical protein